MENSKEIIVLIITIGAGSFSILASVLNWNFFFENQKARLVMKLFGRTGSRIFYGVLGLILFFFAYKIL